MQYRGRPRRIPAGLLRRYRCVRGFLTGEVFDDSDGDRYAAFGETADGRFMYLGLSKDTVRDGPMTWVDEYKYVSRSVGSKAKTDRGSVVRAVHDPPGKYVAAIRKPDGDVGITHPYPRDQLEGRVVPGILGSEPGTVLIEIIPSEEAEAWYRAYRGSSGKSKPKAKTAKRAKGVRR